MIGIRVSSFIPIQSAYLPLISLYFLLSLLYSLISFRWFLVLDKLRVKKYLPVILKKLICWLKNEKNKVQSISNNCNETERLDEDISFLNEIAFFIMFFLMSLSFIVIWTKIST